jgi:hypothetical protein
MMDGPSAKLTWKKSIRHAVPQPTFSISLLLCTFFAAMANFVLDEVPHEGQK